MPAIQVHFEQGAESTQSGLDFGAQGAPDGRFYSLNQLVPGVNVYAGITVGEAFFSFDRVVQGELRYCLFHYGLQVAYVILFVGPAPGTI